MKTLITTLFSLSLNLFISANSSPISVLDVTGKSLRSGVNYHIMPATRGGGITLGPNKTCPLGVTQLQTNNHSLPLTFTPVNPKKDIIRLSTDVNIKFTGPTSCNESNVWKLKYDEIMKQYFVMVGGVEGNPGRETVDNWSSSSVLQSATSVKFYAKMLGHL